MVRYTLLSLFVGWICLFSLKNWYRALCYSLPLLALLERPDMPRTMLGIPGLNPYNIILFFVLLGWLAQKGREGLRWRLPPGLNGLLLLYLLVVTVSFIRMGLDPGGLVEHFKYFNDNGFDLPFPSTGELWKDDFFNAWKWVIPGLLLAHGTNSEKRADLAMKSILFTGLLLGVQIILRMWPALVGLDDLNKRSLRVFDRDIGYHKVQLATYMAATAWGCVVYAANAGSKNLRMFAYGGAGLSTVALMATGGRGGAVAWAACAVLFGVLRWRRILMLAPIVILIGFLLMPSAENRYLTGISGSSGHSRMSEELGTVDAEGRDLYAVTSGRIIVWPRVLQFVRTAPVFGYGMRAYERERVFESLRDDGILPFSAGFHHHPHNAYLMFLLDMGAVGIVILLLFYGRIVQLSIRVFLDKRAAPYIQTVAGFCLAYMVVAMVSGLFACTFYPDQDNVLQWAAMGIFFGVARNHLRLGARDYRKG